MKFLIVGLGNIGSEYDQTRHNIGFDILDFIASEKRLEWEVVKLGSMTMLKYAGKSLYFLKPSTYMNLIGKSLVYWQNELKIPLENVLVLVDDLALPLGTLRLRRKGSSAGHNGLKHIEQMLGHQKYSRLRFGIGDDFKPGRQIEFVLGKWSSKEQTEVEIGIRKSAEAILSFAKHGMNNTMTHFNQK